MSHFALFTLHHNIDIAGMLNACSELVLGIHDTPHFALLTCWYCRHVECLQVSWLELDISEVVGGIPCSLQFHTHLN